MAFVRGGTHVCGVGLEVVDWVVGRPCNISHGCLAHDVLAPRLTATLAVPCFTGNARLSGLVSDADLAQCNAPAALGRAASPFSRSQPATAKLCWLYNLYM